MPEAVTYEQQSQLIRVRSWGNCTIEDWSSSQKQVLQLHKAHGAFRLLVDVREQEAAPATTDIFEFGKEWPQDIQTAILVGEETKKEQEFVETVATNRGKRMRLFEDEGEALKWLGV